MKKIITKTAMIFGLGFLILSNANAQRGRGGERNERRERIERYEPRFNNNYNSRPSFLITIGRNNGYYRQPSYFNRYPSHFISPNFNFGFHLNNLPRGYSSMNYGGMPY